MALLHFNVYSRQKEKGNIQEGERLNEDMYPTFMVRRQVLQDEPGARNGLKYSLVSSARQDRLLLFRVTEKAAEISAHRISSPHIQRCDAAILLFQIV